MNNYLTRKNVKVACVVEIAFGECVSIYECEAGKYTCGDVSIDTLKQICVALKLCAFYDF